MLFVAICRHVSPATECPFFPRFWTKNIFIFFIFPRQPFFCPQLAFSHVYSGKWELKTKKSSPTCRRKAGFRFQFWIIIGKEQKFFKKFHLSLDLDLKPSVSQTAPDPREFSIFISFEAKKSMGYEIIVWTGIFHDNWHFY